MRKTLVVIMIVVAVTAGAWDFSSFELSTGESVSMAARAAQDFDGTPSA